MATLTIHTATYNRGYIIEKLYESLKSQTCKDFEWIITDDGSTDNTANLVNEWKNSENGFPIVYNKLNHVGIPRALNSGISRSSAEWFMMVDSDDYILPNTVELVLKWLEEIKNIDNMAGIGFCRCFPNGNYMKSQKPIIDKSVGFVDASNIERPLYNLDMDMTEVYRTYLHRLYPFQVYPNELYAPECIPFNKMALAGWKLRWRINKLTVCDYLPDGQTRDNEIVRKNPMGFAMFYNQGLLVHKIFKKRFFCAIQMIALSFYAGHMEYLKKTNCLWITIMAFPLGFLLGIRRMLQFRKK